MSDYLCQYSGCDFEVECWVTLAPWAGDMATGTNRTWKDTSVLTANKVSKRLMMKNTHYIFHCLKHKRPFQEERCECCTFSE